MKLRIISEHGRGFDGSSSARERHGFSLVEVAIALGVVTLLLTTFLGVFGPAQKNIQRSLNIKDANRMKDALYKEMSVLRTSDQGAGGGALTGSFDKAFQMISSSHEQAKAVLLYQYKAQLTDNDDDGILPPYTGSDGIQGQDYVVETAVRSMTSGFLQSELAPGVIDGPVFVVKMTQLVKRSDGAALEAWQDGSGTLIAGITDSDNPGAKIAQSADYNKAAIAFKAEFYKLRSNAYNFVSGSNWDFGSLGNSVTDVNMAIRR